MKDDYLSKSKYPLLRLLSYMKPDKRDYLMASLYSVFNKLFDIFPEVLIGGAVDVVVNQKHSWLAKLAGKPSMTFQLITLGCLTFIAWGLESIFQYLYSVKWRNLAQAVEHRLRMEIYQHIQQAQLADIEKTAVGQLIATINDDVNQLERFLEEGINQIIQIIASTLLIGIIFYWCSPLITVFAIMPIPFILIGAFYFQHKLEPRFLKVREKAADIASALNTNLHGVMTIKSYTSESFEAKRVACLSHEYQQANRKTIVVSSMVTPVIRIIILTGFLFTLLIGGYQAIQGSMNVGIFSLLIFLSQRLLWPFSTLADITVNYQRVMASTTRALNLLTWNVETFSEKGLKPDKESQSIHFEQLTFSYPESVRPLFDNFELRIEEKQTIAFVGESGSGKSSLIKLLCRFYQPGSGCIRYGDKNIDEYDLSCWRRQIAMVTQEVFLFSGTVAENIAYASGEYDAQGVRQAAKIAGADRFIQAMPKGYQSQVGPAGTLLSGGQKQRIAIARAVYKDSPILILDEATSAVDNETELAIQHALTRISHHKTTIIIAHRLSTVTQADCIYVLDKGVIVESGTHQQLLNLKGNYYRLWQIQTGNA